MFFNMLSQWTERERWEPADIQILRLGAGAHILPVFWPCHMEAGGSQLCSQALCSQAVFHVSLSSSNTSRSPQTPSKHTGSPLQLCVFLIIHWKQYFTHENIWCQYICLFKEKKNFTRKFLICS